MSAVVSILAGVASVAAVVVVDRTRPELLRRRSSLAVWSLVGASALVAAFAPVDPTGIVGLDVVYRMAFGATAALAAGRARRGARLAAGAVVAVSSAGGGPWSAVAFVALGLATGAASVRRPARPVGALVGGLLAQAALRLGWPDVPYATAVLAGVALVVLVVSGLRHASRRERRTARRVLVPIALGAVVLSALLGLGLLSAGPDLRDGVRAADAGLAAVRAAETDEAVDRLAAAQFHLEEGERALDAPWVRAARVLPVAGRYLGRAQELADAAGAVLEPALDSARLADGDALQIRSGRVALDAVAGLRPPLDRTLDAVPGARAALARVRAERLPGQVRHELADVDGELARAEDDGGTARAALDLLPQLLGADRPRRWFLVMQSPSEQRASGGLAGAYGELTATDGQLELVRSGSIGSLSPAGDWQLSPSVAADYARFAGFDPGRYFQNVTQVPHFPTVGRAITELYPQTGGSPVDGVISVDPTVLAALLSLTGPIEVPSWPRPIGAEDVERVLLYDQYREITESQGDQLVGDVIEATFRRIRTTTLPPPAQVLSTLSPMVAEQRLKLYAVDGPEQELFEAMGADGAMPAVDGDFFQLVTQNASESKIDWFQRRSVSYDVRHNPLTGEVAVIARATITNGAPAQGEPPLVIGGRFPEPGPLGRSGMFVEFFSSLDLDAVTLDGQRIGLRRDRQHERNVYWAPLTLLPGQSATFELHLSGLLDAGDPYRLQLGRQPVLAPDEVTVTVRPTAGKVGRASDGFQPWEGGVRTRVEQQRPRRFRVLSEP